MPGDSDITWKGILVGFLLAGIVGFVMSRMLWAGGLGPIRAFFRPQTVAHKTAKSPFQVFLGCLGRIAILGVFSLAILYVTGVVQQYFPVFPFLRTVTTLRSDQILTLEVSSATVHTTHLSVGPALPTPVLAARPNFSRYRLAAR